ncbi:MAG: 30S ribosomal protein S16 [Gammaproteobacteria bacterium]
MVVIRLARGGKRKHPFYRIVAADKRFPRDGRHLEILGYYNPMARGGEKKLHVELERAKYWLGVGAQPSDTVASLLKKFEKMATAAPAA